VPPYVYSPVDCVWGRYALYGRCIYGRCICGRSDYGEFIQSQSIAFYWGKFVRIWQYVLVEPIAYCAPIGMGVGISIDPGSAAGVTTY
jgi:hypothetical protein